MRARRWSCRHWTALAAQLLAFCRESWLALKGQGLSGRPPAGHLQLGVAGRGHCAALTAATEWRACPTTASPNTDPRQSRFTLLNVNESQLSPFALHHGVSFIGVHYAYFGRVAAKDRPSDHRVYQCARSLGHPQLHLWGFPYRHTYDIALLFLSRLQTLITYFIRRLSCSVHRNRV